MCVLNSVLLYEIDSNQMIPAIEPGLQADSDPVTAASFLALFGVVRRYPGDLLEVSVQDAQRAQNEATKLRAFARKKLSLD